MRICVVWSGLARETLRGLIRKQESEERQMAPTTTVRTPLTLRFVVPTIPKEPREQAHLEEDLTRSDV